MSISSGQQWHIKLACDALLAGGVIAYPTEAVFGLGCDPFNPTAVKKLLTMKGRGLSQGLILIVADYRQIAPWCDQLDDLLIARLKRDSAQPTTWVVPDGGEVMPYWISGGRQSFAVRLTKHPLAAALCRRWGGPLVSTSANFSGCSPARTAIHIRKHFRRHLDYIVVGDVGGEKNPSQIKDLSSGRIIRAG